MGNGRRDFLKKVVASLLSDAGPALVLVVGLDRREKWCKHGSFERIIKFLIEPPPNSFVYVALQGLYMFLIGPDILMIKVRLVGGEICRCY